MTRLWAVAVDWVQSRDGEDWVGYALFACGVGIVCLVVMSSRVDGRCLAHGYPRSSITLGGTAYCLKTERHSDVVRPLSALDGPR